MSFLNKQKYLFDTAVYPQKVLKDSLKLYDKFSSAKIIKETSSFTEVFIEIKPQYVENGNSIKGEMLNHILGSSIVWKLNESE